MLYPVEKLLTHRDNLCTIQQSAKVREALAQMTQGDFSQLPVIDEQGNLVGLISEQTITRTYYHVDENVSLFDLTVDHCMAPAATLGIDADLFEALDQLQRTYAVVIVEGHKPLGLLTFYDTTHFFRNLTEGLIFVEDIETAVRQYIEAIYKTEARREQATINTFGMDGTKPRRHYHRLTLGEYIRLITHPKNWPDFEAYLGPRDLFRTLLDGVRETRNYLAHFRGELDQLQFDQLRRAHDWLFSRRKPKGATVVQVDMATVEISAPPAQAVVSTEMATLPVGQSKYAPLAHWLQQQDPAKPIQVNFEKIESILGDALPPSAREHRSWWANDAAGHSQSRIWLAAGWLVDDVDLTVGNVTFRYTNSAFYQVFFTEVAQRLREIRPGIGHIKTSSGANYCIVNSGRAGFSFTWTFPRQPVLRVELYIDAHDTEKNQHAFAQLEAQKAEIEAQIGAPLEWIPKLGKRAARICITHPTSITASPEALAIAKVWAVETMQKFMDTFQPRIKEISLD